MLYLNIEPLEFSSRWLEGFNIRHSIKCRKKHSEGAEVEFKVNIEAIHNIRVRMALYHLADIYNIDETALYWKLVLDRSLSTEQLSSLKQEKSRISLAITGNGDDTEQVLV